MGLLQLLRDQLRAFLRAEDGTATIEFVLAFPVYMLIFGMTYESGMISIRHVMLERGVDLAVRDIRIGRLTDADPAELRRKLRDRICAAAGILPDCANQLEIEMLIRDPRNWVAVPTAVQCVNRGDASAPKANFTNGGNNELVIMRVCARFDPVLPTSGLGKRIVSSNSSSAAGGSYALVTTTAFVIEPFNREEES